MIFDQVKNLLNKKKTNIATQETNALSGGMNCLKKAKEFELRFHSTYNKAFKNVSLYNNFEKGNRYSIDECNLVNLAHHEERNFLINSAIEDLSLVEGKENHFINHPTELDKNTGGKINNLDYQIFDKHENYTSTNSIHNEKSNINKLRICHCVYYKKKMKTYKTLSMEYKRKYLKEKKISEMLNHKLFYEAVKNSLPNLSNISNPILNSIFNLPIPTQSDKLNSTNISKGEEESLKLVKLLEKLQDNNILFEKLENEIINKDLLIKRQNETLAHQKQTIDSLLEQFNIFLNQANYLVNDLLLLKQNLYEKNFTKMTKEFEEINLSINDYTIRIKEFAERSKELYSGNVALAFSTITEIPCNNIQPEREDTNRVEESEISLTLTKSNIRMISSNDDQSMNLLDLSIDEFN